jgi:butyryl-CoA dehydrogenase
MLLSDEHKLVRETMRAFAQAELAPNAAQWDRESHFPREELRKLGELARSAWSCPSSGAGRPWTTCRSR